MKRLRVLQQHTVSLVILAFYLLMAMMRADGELLIIGALAAACAFCLESLFIITGRIKPQKSPAKKGVTNLIHLSDHLMNCSNSEKSLQWPTYPENRCQVVRITVRKG